MENIKSYDQFINEASSATQMAPHPVIDSMEELDTDNVISQLKELVPNFTEELIELCAKDIIDHRDFLQSYFYKDLDKLQAEDVTPELYDELKGDMFDKYLNAANHILFGDMFEGIVQTGIQKVKSLIGLKSIFKIKYTVTELESEKEEKEEKKKSDPEAVKEYTKTITIKAKDEDDAERKFIEKFDQKVEGMKPKPTVKVDSVTLTKRMEKKNIEIL